jgi:peptidoglycan/xylan/chitin deacetylase (PgdA/CDA1 family)
MKFYWIKTSWIVKKIFSLYLDVSNVEKDKTVYLTFDDGPIPEILHGFKRIKTQVHATFFLHGNNIEKILKYFKPLLAKVTIGNQPHNHLNGWKTTTASYSCKICEEKQSKKQQL